MEPKDGEGGDKSHRLPSFSGPRALKINTVPSRVTVPGRRIFAPNLAVSRDVSDSGTKIKTEGGGDSKRSQGQPYPQRRKDDKRGGHNSRGGKRDFKKAELLQSEGAIFQDGVGTQSVSDRKMTAKASSTSTAGSFRGQISVKSKDVVNKGIFKKSEHSRMNTEGLLTEDDYYSPRMIPMSAEDISPLLQQLQLSNTSGTLMLFRVPENLPLMQEQEIVDDVATTSSKLVSDIASFPEGPIGSMEFPGDGVITLTVGENEFSVEPGTHAEFHQEVLLVNDDNLISMGPVRHKYICRTNIETLISSQPI